MAVLANGGMASLAVTVSASTISRAAVIGTSTIGSTIRSRLILVRASSSEIMVPS